MKKTAWLLAFFCLSAPLNPAAGPQESTPRMPLKISVRDITGTESPRPVTGGVPLAQAVAPEGAQFVLRDERNEAAPLQTSVLARWKDGSARWVLLDFQAAPPSNGTSHFTLACRKEGEAAEPDAAVRVRHEQRPILQSGAVTLASVPNGLLRVSDRFDVTLTLTDSAGQLCTAHTESAEIETQGPMRSTMLLKGAFQTPSGRRSIGFRMRASIFAGLSKVCLEPQVQIDAEKGLIQNTADLKLTLIPAAQLKSATIGGEPGWSGRPDALVRLFQIEDRTYRFEGGAEGTGAKAPGWMEFDDGRGAVAVALRDFWQQWPKSLEVKGDELAIGLFPAFGKGAFDHMTPWYKYQYLFENQHYRLRTGQAPRWHVWLDLAGDGEALARCANAPLLPAADPAQAIATGVWGAIAPAGSRGMAQYDRWAENLFDNAYCHSIEAQRDYGQMNWGDWFGERQCNWGNHEYDTAKQILLQFARTGDPKYIHVGDTAARHTSEIDVVHFVNEDLKTYFEKDLGGNKAYPTRPGMVHEHCVGHVGGFYSVETIRKLFVSFGTGNSPRPYLCLDPYNLGHIWTQGMVYDYFLTGDPWLRETVQTIGGNLVQLVEDRKMQFKGHSHCGRVNGWTMLALAGWYDLDFSNERCLGAMKLLVDDALSEQNPETGGWHYRLPAGHCNCTPEKHVGEAGFIGSIRLNGLSRYYELTGDPRIPGAVKRGVTHLNNDTWIEEKSDWRYTSCPFSSPIGQTGVTIDALVNSVKMSRDPEHLRILRKAWEAKFQRSLKAPTARPGLGKTYSTIMYGCPEAMNLFVNGAADKGIRP